MCPLGVRGDSVGPRTLRGPWSGPPCGDPPGRSLPEGAILQAASRGQHCTTERGWAGCPGGRAQSPEASCPEKPHLAWGAWGVWE